MPKEIIAEKIGSYDVLVGWSKENEYVQLAVVTTDRNPVDIRIGQSDEIFQGLYSTLTPESIDDLIKVLRKAKRQAYPTKKV